MDANSHLRRETGLSMFLTFWFRVSYFAEHACLTISLPGYLIQSFFSMKCVCMYTIRHVVKCTVIWFTVWYCDMV